MPYYVTRSSGLKHILARLCPSVIHYGMSLHYGSMRSWPDRAVYMAFPDDLLGDGPTIDPTDVF